ncbi:MAG: hypothetical protein ACRBM6_06680 [Geminicoccales bacterium]
MIDVDCAIVMDGSLGPAAQEQVSRLLKAHWQASIRTGLLVLRDDRTDLGWLGAEDIIGRLDDDTLIWIDPNTPCRATLTLIVSPKLAKIERTARLKLRTVQAVIWPIDPVITLPPDAETGEPRTLAEEAPSIARDIAERLDSDVLWAPRTAGERHYLKQNAIGLHLTERIWWPLLEEDQANRGCSPKTNGTVGRHWQGDLPLDPKAFGELAAAFGDCWPMDLTFHGQASVLKSLPPFDQSQGMTLVDAATEPLDDFLQGISLFIAAGDWEVTSSVPFSVFEAMQADVVVIAASGLGAVIDSPLPEADLADLMGLACSLLGDDIALERARRQQRSLIAERHSAKAHQARIAPHLKQTEPALPSTIAQKTAQDRILFVSDDSPHLEHLTRQLAIAERLPASLKPHFITTARNARMVEQRGFPVEYVPAHNSMPYRDLFEDASLWNYWFERHLAELIAMTSARALVFDGVYPFGGVMANRQRFPHLPFAWILQPLWRPNAVRDALKHGREVDLMIEPGDLAKSFDRGPLQAIHYQALSTDPIRLDEPLARATARQALGLDDDSPVAILLDPTLSNEMIDGETATTLLDDLQQQGATFWSIDPASTSFAASWSREVRRLEEPDAGRYRSAFDGAISPADYRSLHDQIAAGLPSILLCGLGSSTDDQAARTAFAEKAGFAIALRSGDVYGARQAARQLVDQSGRAEMVEALERHQTDNGAEMAALAIADLVYTVSVAV